MRAGGVRKRWRLPAPLPTSAESQLTDYPPVLRQVLATRGLLSREQAAAFLDSPESTEHDPRLLAGMDEAVLRIQQAVRSGEPIVVYGDYDADGVCATVLLVETLQGLGAKVRKYIPNRFDEGYGLNQEAITLLSGEGARLLITVDCGIRSAPEAEHARRLGVGLIITDHHQPGDEFPSALAVINPGQPGDAYPFPSLAGVGLAYKLAQALLRAEGGSDSRPGLDLVAIGTIADLAPLSGENRALVAAGLRMLNRGTDGLSLRLGARALAQVAGLRPGRIDAHAVGFALAPRLNAAGRLESAEEAYLLLSTQDREEADRLAARLDQANRLRQRLTQETVARAQSTAIGPEPIPDVILACDASFNPGIVGLAASRLADEFYRPALIGAIQEGSIRASARSIPEFHITQALDGCSDLLLRHGGHAAAAGLTLRADNWDRLAERLRSQAAEAFQGKELRPVLRIDAITQLPELDASLIEGLERFEPCGYGNPRPVLAALGVEIVDRRPVGRDRSHLKLTFRQGGAYRSGIGFGLGPLAPQLPARVDVAFHPEWNEYLGVRSLELRVVDLRPAGGDD